MVIEVHIFPAGSISASSIQMNTFPPVSMQASPDSVPPRDFLIAIPLTRSTLPSPSFTPFESGGYRGLGILSEKRMVECAPRKKTHGLDARATGQRMPRQNGTSSDALADIGYGYDCPSASRNDSGIGSASFHQSLSAFSPSQCAPYKCPHAQETNPP